MLIEVQPHLERPVRPRRRPRWGGRELVGGVLGTSGAVARAGQGLNRLGFEVRVDPNVLSSGPLPLGGVSISPQLFRRISSQGLPVFSGALPDRRLFERLRFGNLDPPNNFPGIDRINRTTARGTSLRTIDLTTASAADPDLFRRSVERSVNQLSAFGNTPTVRASSLLGEEVVAPALRSRRLELGVQAGLLSDVQRRILANEAARAASLATNPVELVVFEIF